MRRLFLRLWHALRPGRAEAELSREIASHLALLEDDYVARGLTRDDARAAARRALGSTALTADRHRDARSFVWMDDLRRDAVHALRLIRRNPIFASTAALSLAIGIGANTTIFTVANALLFRPPAGVVEPERLVDIGRTVRRGGAFNPTSYPDYLDLRRRATTLDGVFASHMFPSAMSLRTSATPSEPVSAMDVTVNYFSVLGVVPAAGRLFEASDSEEPGASAIVVLSHRFWTTRFARDPAIVGTAVRLNERPFTVVGVAPEGFQGTGVRRSDLWIPLTATVTPGSTSFLNNRGGATVIVGARLTRGVAQQAAAAEVDAIGAALARDYPAEDGGKGLRLLAHSPVPGNAGPIALFLVLLMAIVSLVLVVACANVAGVLLARAAARRREIAIRLAIGVSRARLVRQLLTETLVLFAIGAAAGVLLARVLASIVVAVLPALPFPIDLNLALDVRVLVFTAGLSLVAALASGLVPALQASRADAAAVLTRDAPAVIAGLRLRHLFLVAQIAASIVLVVVAGLFVRSLQQVAAGSPGFDAHGVELLTVRPTVAGYTDITGPLVLREVVERVRQQPRVSQATIAAVLPGGFERIGLAGLEVPSLSVPDAQLLSADWNIIEPGYFATLRMPMLAGRDFDASDRAGAPWVAILGEHAAARFWPGQNPIGQYVVQRVPGPPSATGASTKRLLIVGIARDPSYGTLVDNTTGISIYVPLQQQYIAELTTIVARSADGRPVTNEIRAAIAAVNPNLPITSTQAAEEYTSLGLLPQRIGAWVAGSLGLVGLLLAAVGVYGVTAYVVTCRTREFGIRIALGATRRDITAMVVRHGLRVIAIGSAVGLVIAAGAARVVSSVLFGIGPNDPPTFIVAAVLFAVVGLLASYAPARRATRIEATDALRCE